jgi:hypothetical protein
MTGPSTVTGTGNEACPYCGVTRGVQSTPTPSRVQAWTCTVCRTDWAITVVNPQPYFDRLAAAAEQFGATRSVLRQLIRLGGDAPGLTDEQLRNKLVMLPTGQGWCSPPEGPRPAAG